MRVSGSSTEVTFTVGWLLVELTIVDLPSAVTTNSPGTAILLSQTIDCRPAK